MFDGHSMHGTVFVVKPIVPVVSRSTARLYRGKISWARLAVTQAMFVITNSRVFVVVSQKGDGVLDETTQAEVLLDDDV